jgi:toxin ParE1/3/4
VDIQISRAAQGDLADIWLFGASEWSLNQAESYSSKLMAAISRLAENPFLAPFAEGLPDGSRRLVFVSHVVIYRVSDDRIEVLRVLHQSRDAGRWVE